MIDLLMQAFTLRLLVLLLILIGNTGVTRANESRALGSTPPARIVVVGIPPHYLEIEHMGIDMYGISKHISLVLYGRDLRGLVLIPSDYRTQTLHIVTVLTPDAHHSRVKMKRLGQRTDLVFAFVTTEGLRTFRKRIASTYFAPFLLPAYPSSVDDPTSKDALLSVN